MIAPPDGTRECSSELGDYERRERCFLIGFVAGVLWCAMVAGVIWWPR